MISRAREPQNCLVVEFLHLSLLHADASVVVLLLLVDEQAQTYLHTSLKSEIDIAFEHFNLHLDYSIILLCFNLHHYSHFYSERIQNHGDVHTAIVENYEQKRASENEQMLLV